MLRINPEALAQFKDQAVREYPKESGGYLLSDGSFVPAVNKHHDPQNNFAFDPIDIIRLKPVGILHTHPDGELKPSEADMIGQISTNIPWGIATCNPMGCSNILWFGDGIEKAPLVGRHFIHGVQDCYSLIRDYYKIEKGITLKEFARPDEWWNQNTHSFYDTKFIEAGFQPISLSELQPDDVVLMRIRSQKTNHGGIYVGNNLILHHFQGGLSKREPIGRWMKHIVHTIRYTA